MNNSKLLRILKVMQESELKDIEKFVQSGFYNKNETIIQLFMYLRKQYPDWKAEKLEKRKVWSKIGNKEPFNEVNFRKTMSNLVQLIEKYIVTHLTFSPAQHHNNLLQFYEKHYLTKDAADVLKEWENNLYLTEINNREFFLEKAEWAKNKMLHPMDDKQKQIAVIDFLKETDIAYIVTQLQWQTIKIANEGIVKSHHISPFWADTLANIEKNKDWLQIPAIYIYYHLYKMIQNEQETQYFEIVNTATEQYAQYLSREEWVYIGAFLRNYCIRQNLAGNLIFHQILFKLYQAQLKNGFIFSYNQLSALNFKNIVQAAIKCQEFEWANQFIVDYQGRLAEQERENLVLLCISLIAFAQKKYKIVLQKSNEIQRLTDIKLEIDVKMLRIKTYYELKEWEAMTSAVEALKMYLSRYST